MALAQQTDPVEDLRILLPGTMAIEENPAALNYRKENLLKAVDNLKSISDMRRALSLSEWKDQDIRVNQKLSQVDQEVRAVIGKKIEQIIEQMVEKGSPTDQVAVATMIGEIGPKIRSVKPNDFHGFARELTPYLVALSKSQDSQVRQAAGRALGNINPDPASAISALSALLKSPVVEDRRAASEALGELVRNVAQLHKKGSVQTGVDALPPDIMEASARVVGPGGECSKDSDAVVRRNGMEAIYQAAATLQDLVPKPDEPTLLPPSTRLWSDAEKRMVQEATQKYQADKALYQPLIDAFKEQAENLARTVADPDAEVRITVRHALDMIATARLRLLRYEWSIPNPNVPKDNLQAPTDALALALRPSMLIIAARTGDPDYRVRRGSLDFLESLEDAAGPAVPRIALALGDRDLFIRWAAARTLGKIGPIQPELTVPRLAKLVQVSQDTDVRETAAGTLRRYGTVARAALPDLIGGLNVGEPAAQEAIMKAIISVGGDDAKLALPQLKLTLRSPTATLRRAAAETIGLIGPAAVDAVPDLRALLNDDDSAVRAAASEALVNIARVR
jgi:HEAT repeat protein